MNHISSVFALACAIICFSFTLSAQAQTPQGINYQAAARNAEGEPLSNQNVSVQLSLLSGSPNGAAVYRESHQTRTTPEGVFSLVFGQGNNTIGLFSALDWSEGPYYLRVEIDENGGNNYVEMGVTQLMSVPYALMAENLANPPELETGVSLDGEGTPQSPLEIARQTATQGQTLKWNGSAWAPANDDVSFDGTLTTSPRISGNGTENSPLDIAGMNASVGQVLKWTGVSWTPADDIGTDYTGEPPLVADNINRTLSLADGRFVNDVMYWNGAAWVIGQPEFGGSGGQWQENGANLYRTNGNVGIGTSSPEHLLHVSGNSNLDDPQLLLNETEKDFARVNFGNDNSAYYWGLNARPESSGQQGVLNFYYSFENQDVMTLTDLGAVGIGTTAPEAGTRLDVISRDRYAGLFSTDLVSNDATVINAFFAADADVDAVAVAGTSEPAWGKGFGGQFYGGNTGVLGAAYAGRFDGNYAAIGVYGESYDDPDAAAAGTRIGVYGFGRGGDFNIGVFGSHNNNGNNNYAGLFEGRVFVDGFLEKAAGSFKIDHPDDPANKYLVHSFVESPEMLNLYNGVVKTGPDSLAVVELPDYFTTLNKDFRYQLTVIGAMEQAYVWEEIEGNTFVVKTSAPNVKVSWQVTGVRNDPFAQENRLQDVVEKQGSERGKYLHPELYGQPESAGMFHNCRPSDTPRNQPPTRDPARIKRNSSAGFVGEVETADPKVK